MFKISYKFGKNESYQIFVNIRKPNLAYFTSILKKLAQNDCEETCLTKTIHIAYVKVTKM
jgi:hypothetical protein